MTGVSADGEAGIAVPILAVQEQGPLVAPGVVRRLAPFVLSGVAGIVLLFVDLSGGRVRSHVFSGVLGAVVVLAALMVPWRRVPRRLQVSLPLLYIVHLGIGAAAARGLSSGLLPLLVVPLLWLAMYEDRVAFAVGLVLTVAILAVLATDHPTHDDIVRGVAGVVLLVVVLPSVYQLVTANRSQTMLLLTASEQDWLTGLSNRRGFERRVNVTTGGLGVIFVDLNHFKAINDDYGHDCGDQLLCQVADRLRNTVRPGDQIVRLGGDEFLVSCAGGPAIVADIADRVDTAIRAAPYRLDQQTVSISASVGFSHSDTPRRQLGLISAADHEMYAIKNRQQPAPTDAIGA